MSFWTTSTGENLASKSENERQSYTPPSNEMEPIPDGSKVRSFIKEAGWDKDRDGNRYVKLRWDVTKPDAVAKRVVFQKLWVKDGDPNAKDPNGKRDKALSMLMKIDAMAGGKLAAAGSEPTDDQLLMALANKEMVLLLRVWEMTGSDGSAMSGNWIQDVFPCEGTELIVRDAKPAGGGSGDDLGSDEIPFD